LTALPVTRWAVTAGLAAAVTFAWLAALISGRADDVVTWFGFQPAGLSSTMGIIAPLSGNRLISPWLTPLTACLVHRDAVHLGFNLVMLIFCGRAIEPAIGRGAMAVLLVVGAFGAALAEWAYAPSNTAIVIGASGAISAIVAVYALLYNDQTVRAFGPIPGNIVRLLWLGAAWVGVQLLIGIAYGGQIAFMAHIGGFVAGLLLARPLLRWRFRQRG
jgi:membrane associated rhomboid family serine protease